MQTHFRGMHFWIKLIIGWTNNCMIAFLWDLWKNEFVSPKYPRIASLLPTKPYLSVLATFLSRPPFHCSPMSWTLTSINTSIIVASLLLKLCCMWKAMLFGMGWCQMEP